MTDETSPILHIDDLSVDYRVRDGYKSGVSGVSLSLGRRQTIAIVGESGSGKSTLAKAVIRLMSPNAEISHGRILFEGADLAEASEQELTRVRGKSIGYVPQDPMSNFNPLQRVGTQIAEVLEVHRACAKSEVAGRVVELLKLVGIPDPEVRARQYPHQFSGGMRQRALIAMALACSPSLIIADEPTSALDVTVQKEILDHLDRLIQETGSSMIFVTHDLGLAAERADRIAVLYRGQLVETGDVRSVLENPQHEYTRRLIAAAPTLEHEPLVSPVPDVDAAPIVMAIDATKVYPIRRPGQRKTTFVAADAVTLDIRPGETVSIVGESGSGKSTTSKMVLDLESPDQGEIRYRGTALSRLDKRAYRAYRRHVQAVFQNPYASLDSKFTIAEAVAEPLIINRVGTKDSRDAQVRQLLTDVALPHELLDAKPAELSGGQLQRVALARALALDPEVLVLDEAVSALDVLVQQQVLDLLVDLQRARGLSYLFVSHDLAVVRLISHRIHVMQAGKIVESGTPEQIFESPQHPYTRRLLGAVPSGRPSGVSAL